MLVKAFVTPLWRSMAARLSLTSVIEDVSPRRRCSAAAAIERRVGGGISGRIQTRRKARGSVLPQCILPVPVASTIGPRRDTNGFGDGSSCGLGESRLGGFARDDAGGGCGGTGSGERHGP